MNGVLESSDTPSAAHWWWRTAQSLWRLLVAPCCHLCGEPLPDCDRWVRRGFCPGCYLELPHVGADQCRRCGAPVGPGLGRPDGCHSCPPRRTLSGVVAPLEYRESGRKLLHIFKYRRRFRLHRPLAELIWEQLEQRPFVDLIDRLAAVPLHWRRRIWRGYNQSQLLAETLGRRLDRPVSSPLGRTRHTPPLFGLSREERQDALAGVFEARPRGPELSGEHILLVDDVMTSGATLIRCARELKAAGARSVYAAVICRASLVGEDR